MPSHFFVRNCEDHKNLIHYAWLRRQIEGGRLPFVIDQGHEIPWECPFAKQKSLCVLQK